MQDTHHYPQTALSQGEKELREQFCSGQSLLPVITHQPHPLPNLYSALRGHHQWESHICLSRSHHPLVHPHTATKDTGLECSVYTSTFIGSLDMTLYLSRRPVWGPADVGARLASDLIVRYNSKNKLLEIPDSPEDQPLFETEGKSTR